MVLFEKSKMVSVAFIIMEDMVLFPARSRFPLKTICCFAFESASSSCYLLQSIAII